jgi:pterin-4a-carbinolamine dehydratase
MNNIIGREINFAVAPETVRGVAEAVAERTVRKVTCNLIPRAERVIDDTTFGRLEDAERVRTVRKWSEGDVEGILHADVLGYFLLNLYGAVESTLDETGVYSHEFTLEQSIAHATLTLFVEDGGVRQEKIAGGVIDTMTLGIKTDDYIRYTASFIGKAGVADTSTLPALATEYDFVSRDVSVKIADTEAGLTGATALKLKDTNLSFKANAIADYVFGSYSPDNIYNKQFTIEGDFSKNMEDTTFKELYEGDDFVYMQITIEGEALIGATKHPKIVVLFNKVQVTDWSRDSKGDDLVTEKISFKAFLNATDEQASMITVTNTTVSYAVAS